MIWYVFSSALIQESAMVNYCCCCCSIYFLYISVCVHTNVATNPTRILSTNTWTHTVFISFDNGRLLKLSLPKSGIFQTENWDVREKHSLLFTVHFSKQEREALRSSNAIICTRRYIIVKCNLLLLLVLSWTMFPLSLCRGFLILLSCFESCEV